MDRPVGAASNPGVIFVPQSQNSLKNPMVRTGLSLPHGSSHGSQGSSPRPGTESAGVVRNMGRSASPTPMATQQPPEDLEQKLKWLEEDVAVLQARLTAVVDGGLDDASAANDSKMQALYGRLEKVQAVLAAEQRARDTMKAKVRALEEQVQQERQDRDTQLNAFSTELEDTMKDLIGRIDDTLGSGVATMQERTEATEKRLRLLLQRVDEGLTANAAVLQGTLGPNSGGANGGPLGYSPSFSGSPVDFEATIVAPPSSSPVLETTGGSVRGGLHVPFASSADGSIRNVAVASESLGGTCRNTGTASPLSVAGATGKPAINVSSPTIAASQPKSGLVIPFSMQRQQASPSRISSHAPIPATAPRR